MIAELFARLGAFAHIDVVAMARGPHQYVEAFYGEWVTTAHPGGARSIAETLVDHGDNLTNYASLFAPFEAATGQDVILGDFDDLRAHANLWSGFCQRAGLPHSLEEMDLPRYASPDRVSIQLLQLINTVVASQTRRQKLMQAYFADPSRVQAPADTNAMLCPDQQIDLLDRFEASSAAFCSARGYTPDLNALRANIRSATWTPANTLPLEALLAAGVQIAGDNPPLLAVVKQRKTSRNRYRLVIQPRPWVASLLDKVFVAR